MSPSVAVPVAAFVAPKGVVIPVGWYLLGVNGRGRLTLQGIKMLPSARDDVIGPLVSVPVAAFVAPKGIGIPIGRGLPIHGRRVTAAVGPITTRSAVEIPNTIGRCARSNAAAAPRPVGSYVYKVVVRRRDDARMSLLLGTSLQDRLLLGTSLQDRLLLGTSLQDRTEFARSIGAWGQFAEPGLNSLPESLM